MKNGLGKTLFTNKYHREEIKLIQDPDFFIRTTFTYVFLGMWVNVCAGSQRTLLIFQSGGVAPTSTIGDEKTVKSSLSSTVVGKLKSETE